MSKVLIKQLPNKKALKEYYNQLHKVKGEKAQTIKIEYTKQGIYLTLKIENNYIPSFYESIEIVNVITKEILIRIPPNHFEHVLNNYNNEKEYINEQFNKI